MPPRADVVIVGAGAAGLMAAIHAARAVPDRRIVVLDGAAKPGAKILVAGGGRCNVTHDHVDEGAYAGASRSAIRKVLRRFDVPQTVAFFESLGVTLKREETGKLFPVTDSARTVLNALLGAADAAGVELLHPCRVGSVARLDSGGFRVSGAWGTLDAARLILATGGRSLPKSGSDGQGYALAQALGHRLTPRIFPALVPLTLPRNHFITQLSGIAVPAALTLHGASGKVLTRFTGSTLCTHFGLSGPSVLDISRYYTDARASDPAAELRINWLPDETSESLDAALIGLRQPVGRWLSARLPERLARVLCLEAGVDPATTGTALTRAARHALVATVTALTLPITGDRGYTYAEVTAGGIPLDELHLKTLESRVCPGLYLCGEICDVDGRIGGYNFQWAWASGWLAGTSAAASLETPP
jgi:predicted Rossmann fold flavoprotein